MGKKYKKDRSPCCFLRFCDMIVSRMLPFGGADALSHANEGKAADDRKAVLCRKF